MKKSKFLLLLVPSLFLFTSCDTAPKNDGITEKEARDFISSHYKIKEDNFNAPKETSTVSWNIRNFEEENDENPSAELIATFIGGSTTISDAKGSEKIDNNRLSTYKNELSHKLSGSDISFGELKYSAVMGLNIGIFNHLYNDSHEDVDLIDAAVSYDFKYKYEGSGLMIKIVPSDNKTSYTRTHHYNQNGYETKYEVDINKNDLNFSMTINFKY